MTAALRRLAALIVCVGCGETASPLGEPGPLDAVGEIQLGLRTDGERPPTGRLIGWNVGRGTLYGPSDDPLHPQWRSTAREEAFALLAEIRGPSDSPPLVRFSGLQIDGALGNDGYHFWDFAEPGHTIADDDNMAPFQAMTIVEEMGAQPLVTLNFGSGTATEAADYVQHLVGEDTADPLVSARAFWGHPEPYRPVAYELGNEIYGFWNTGFVATGPYSYANPEALNGGDPAWHDRPAADAADYAARALDYVDAVLAVDADARFWIPLAQAPMDAWGGLERALPSLEPLLLHPAVQAVVVHHYQVDDAVTLGFGAIDDPALSLAGTELVRSRFSDLRQRLDALRPDDPLQIAVTEYHVAGAFTLGGYDAVGDTHRVGLGVADQLIFYAQQRVDQAAQHMAVAFGGEADEEFLFESWYNPAADRGGLVRPRSSYVATQLVAAYLLANTADVEPIEVPTARYEGGPGFDYPLVHAAAFVDGDLATVVMLHRDLDRAHTVSIDLPEGEGWRFSGAVAYAPPDVSVPIGDQDVLLVEPVVDAGVNRVIVTAPPHSLIGLAFARP